MSHPLCAASGLNGWLTMGQVQRGGWHLMDAIFYLKFTVLLTV